MKIRSLVTLCAIAILLTACAPSLETTRNEAFIELDQMSGLTRIERDEVALDLNRALDTSSVERAMDKAHKFQDERKKRKQAKKEKKEKLNEFLDTLEGKTLVLIDEDGDEDRCVGLRAFFSSQGTVEVSGKKSECMPDRDFKNITWEANKNEEDLHFGLMLNEAPQEEKILGENRIYLRTDPRHTRWILPQGEYEIR